MMGLNTVLDFAMRQGKISDFGGMESLSPRTAQKLNPM